MKVWCGQELGDWVTILYGGTLKGQCPPVTFAKAKYSRAKIPANYVTGLRRRCSEIFAALLGGALRLN